MLAGASPIVFLATRNPERLRRFYETTLGLPYLGDDGAALHFDLAGTLLRIAKVQRFAPAAHTVLGWRVADLNPIVDALLRAGLRLEQYAGFDQDPLGIWTAPTGERVAWFKDPDGNLLSLTQAAP